VPFGGAGFWDFQVATDANGNISQFQLALLKPLPPHALGQPVDAFAILNTTSPITYADHQLPCDFVSPENICGVTNNDQVIELAAGGWRIVPEPRTIPSQTPAMLVLLGLLLAAMSAWGMAFRRAT